MVKMGFALPWINLIMKCVETVSFSVRMNGQYSEYFTPSRGIRQGDPISPYLFLLCSEGLSALLKHSGQLHLSRGIRVGIHAPWVSHLLFADDCLVFTHASALGATKLHAILETYRQGSGQLVNKNNPAVFFSGNCTQEMKQVVHTATGINVEVLVEKYLGLPTALGRSTDSEFEHIITKIKKLLRGWTPKNMSSSAREVLVKAICQAIPTYSMSCFRLSKKMCKRITSIVARFWWGGDDKKCKIHWKKWAKIAIPKSSGGMGFRDFQLFNQGMLAKQAWRLMDKPDSLCARVMRGKYFHDKDLLCASNKRNSSHIWKAILHRTEALKKGLIKRVGDGSSINVWEDPWIPSHIGKKPFVGRPDSEVHKVSDLIEADLVQWNIDKITANFYEPDISAICSIPIGRFTEDFWAWDLEKSGNFAVRSCYRLYQLRNIKIKCSSLPQVIMTNDSGKFCGKLTCLLKKGVSGGE
jgi:hypothetical protein